MMKKMRKTLSLLLSIILCFSLLPATALAEDGTYGVKIVTSNTNVASGQDFTVSLVLTGTAGAAAPAAAQVEMTASSGATYADKVVTNSGISTIEANYNDGKYIASYYNYTGNFDSSGELLLATYTFTMGSSEGSFSIVNAIAAESGSVTVNGGNLDFSSEPVKVSAEASVESYSVTITVGSNTTTSGGDLVQTGLTGTMVAVNVTAADGYTLSAPQISGSGITAEINADGSYTVSGTPSSDVTVAFSDAVASVEFPWEGSGTEEDPYQIASENNLIELAKYVNGDYGTPYPFEGIYFRVENDITLTQAWTPIGAKRENKFRGVFDGNNKSFAMSSFQSGINNAGLFGFISGAVIKNVIIKDFGTTLSGENRAASLIYSAENSAVENCANYAAVSGREAGGLIYEASGSTITGCVNYGEIRSLKGGVGGIINMVTTSTVIRACMNFGDITGPGNANNYAGGILGQDVFGTTGVSIIDCGNEGNIINSGANLVGGIAGICGGTITGSYNTGDVSGAQCVGGIVGCTCEDTTNLKSSFRPTVVIDSCYNTGTITSTAASVGGILGGGKSNANNALNIGSINHASGNAIGANNTGSNNYYLYGTSTNGNNATPVTNAELLTLASQLGGNFKQGASYPILVWQEYTDKLLSTASASGSTATVSIAGSDLSDAVDEDGCVSVSGITSGTGIESVGVTVAARTATALASDEAVSSFTITTDLGAITFDKTALTELFSISGADDVVLTITKSGDSTASIFTASMSAGENALFVDGTSSGEISLALNYTRSASNMKVIVKDDDGATLDSGYSSGDHVLSFTVRRLGAYTVTEEEKQNGAHYAAEGVEAPQDTIWDGYSIDVSWYNTTDTEFTISTAAQLAGVAAIVNGIFNEDGYVYGDSNQTIIVDNYYTDGTTGGNNMATTSYHMGGEDFNGKTIYLDADLDMSAGNYMPIGGQYLMTKNDSDTKLSSSFNGTFDGQGHSVTIVCDRHCSNGNFGDGASVGFIGRLGCHDGDDPNIWADSPTVRRLAVYGSVHANRSVGGIVGKIGKTNEGALIELCANYAKVSNTDAKGVGGICGASWNGGTIRNCYNAGDVSTTYSCPAGGIGGSNEITLENCYNIGTIKASVSSYAMAIGTNNGEANYDDSVINCWYLNGCAPGGGYFSGSAINDGNLESDYMKSAEFVSKMGDAFTLDSSDINNGYPILTWQADSTVPVTSLTLNKTTLALTVGKSETLTAEIEPENATDQTLAWKSSDESVATVNSEGLVYAVAPGTAKITVSVGEKTADCVVTVSKTTVPVRGVTLSRTILVLNVGSSETLTATVEPDNATDSAVSWTSSDSAVATVDSNGRVSGNKAGTVVITATAGGVSADCEVTVEEEAEEVIDVTGITLNKSTLSLTVGDSETLIATVTPNNATNPNVSWKSSVESVASVSSGKVTAHKAGTTIITATAGGSTASCVVTINDQIIEVSDIILNKESLALTAGSAETLIAVVLPSNATNSDITWTTSDSSVATVANGKVSGIKEGSAMIVATAGSKTATCVVTVSRATVDVSNLILSKTTLSLQAGKSEALTATVLPSNATNPTVSWISSDSTVANVDASGNVTALRAGSATIFALAGGKVASCSVTVTQSSSIIILNKTALNLTVGSSETLTATISPAADVNVAWQSSDPSVATVSNGLVTAIKAGTTTVTATADGNSASCSVTVTDQLPAVTAIILNKVAISLVAGTSDTLTATISPSNATNASVTWQSSDSSVATVSNGIVAAVKAGTAIITASAGTISATCSVTVTDSKVDVTSVSLNKSDIKISAGSSETLTATILPSNATNVIVNWQSSDTSVATVSNGVVTGIKAGTATITAIAGDKSAACTVTVSEGITGITLNKTTLTLAAGTTETLVATLTPTSRSTSSIVWQSSDPSIATVANGVVTAVKAGSTTITAAAAGKSASCSVTVTEGIADITLDKTSLNLLVGGSDSLKVTINPSSAAQTEIIWQSSNPTVVTVSNGVVTALQVGTAVITVTAGGKTATCVVAVAASSEELNNSDTNTTTEVDPDGSRKTVTTVTQTVENDDGTVTEKVSKSITTESPDGSVGVTIIDEETTASNTMNDDGTVTKSLTTSGTSSEVMTEPGGSVVRSTSSFEREANVTTVTGEDGSTAKVANITENIIAVEATTDPSGNETVVIKETASETTSVTDEDGNGTVNKTRTETVHTGADTETTVTETRTEISTDDAGTQISEAHSVATTTDAGGHVTTSTSVSVSAETSDGTIAEQVSDSDGNLLSGSASFSEAAIENARSEAEANGQVPSVTAPVSFTAADEIDEAARIVLSFPDSVVESDEEIQVNLLVENAANDDSSVNEGIIVYALHPITEVTGTSLHSGFQAPRKMASSPFVHYRDGEVITGTNGKKYQTELIKQSVVTEDGRVVFNAEGDLQILLVDNSKTFKDVSKSSWYFDEVDFVTAREIYNGNGDGTFTPNDAMTRGMIAQVFFNFDRDAQYGKSSVFSDITDSDWWADAVNWAASVNIINGFDDGAYHPTENITREQLVTILYRYAAGQGMSTSERADFSSYADSDSVQPYAREAMQWAVATGLIRGMDDGTLNPSGNATRAQTATIIHRFVELLVVGRILD